MIPNRIALLALSLALAACKAQPTPATAAPAPAPTPAATQVTAAPVTTNSATNCPDADFDSFLKKFSADIAVQEKMTADPLIMSSIDPDAQPEPKPVIRSVSLREVEWPAIPNIEAARNGGREVVITEEAEGRSVLVRTAGTDDQQVYHFKQQPCWMLTKVEDQSL